MERKEQHEGCLIKEEDHLYRIGMFAAMNHITVKTLRFYEAQGLLIPAYVDEENGYRYYKMNQMAVIHQITALKQAGFTLEDIARINSGSDGNAFLLKKKADLLQKIAELTRQVAVIEGYLAKEDVRLDTPVLIRTIPGVVVAAMRKRIAAYEDLFDLMPEMGEKMERAGCVCAIPEYCITRYPEPGYKEENILVETCQAVTEAKKEGDGLYFETLPKIQAACVYHKGPYATLSEAYSTVLSYMESHGLEIAGEIRENYIDGVWNKDSEAEWLTEVQVPVRKCDRDE